MKTFFKVITILSYVFSVVMLLAIAMICYMYFRYRRAIQYTLKNSIYCGTPTCPMTPTELPAPVDVAGGMKTYSLPLAQYCANLVLRAVNSFYDHSPFALPVGTLDLGDLFSDAAQKTAFGKILLLESQKTILVVFRGTQTMDELKGDLNTNQINTSVFPAARTVSHQVRLQTNPSGKFTSFSTSPGVPLLHGGFQRIYSINKAAIERSLASHPDVHQMVFCGHSLGAAIAVIGALTF
jgi:hypothetical protein